MTIENGESIVRVSQVDRTVIAFYLLCEII